MLKWKTVCFTRKTNHNKVYDFDENLNIVPTLQEAYDFIDMEEIERQLEL